MDFMIAAHTDVGIVKKTNQDSVSITVINTPQGRMAMGILCDGMGGLAQGEVASASVVHAFRKWTVEELPELCRKPLEEETIRCQWERIIREQNRRIREYGDARGIRLGTTAVVLLVTQDRYYLLNVGDSRGYLISDGLYQLTADQSFVAREVTLGRMTPEQAQVDPRRNMLLQCVGASEEVYPDLFTGEVKPVTVFMLCSDGFRDEITPREIYESFHPLGLTDEQTMHRRALELVELNKQRRERDNITVGLIRLC